MLHKFNPVYCGTEGLCDFALNTNLCISPCAQKYMESRAYSLYAQPCPWLSPRQDCAGPMTFPCLLLAWAVAFSAVPSNGVLSLRLESCPSTTKTHQQQQLTVDTPRGSPGSLSGTSRICKIDNVLKYLRSENYKTRCFHIFSLLAPHWAISPTFHMNLGHKAIISKQIVKISLN